MEGPSSQRMALKVDVSQDRKIYCLQARACIFQPGNFTGWSSEGVNVQVTAASEPPFYTAFRVLKRRNMRERERERERPGGGGGGGALDRGVKGDGKRKGRGAIYFLVVCSGRTSIPCC